MICRLIDIVNNEIIYQWNISLLKFPMQQSILLKIRHFSAGSLFEKSINFESLLN